MQKRIDEIQSKYREWCELLPQLEADIARWKHAASLMQDMMTSIPTNTKHAIKPLKKVQMLICVHRANTAL